MKRKILIIEDDPRLRDRYIGNIKRLYPHIEWSFSEAENKDEAVEFLEKEEYDKILLDGNLSCGQHGRDVLAFLSEDQRSKTCVLSCDNGFILEAEKKGILAFDKSDFSGKMNEIFSKII